MSPSLPLRSRCFNVARATETRLHIVKLHRHPYSRFVR